MKALDTTRQLLTSAGITGSLFALPLGLALLWTVDLPEIESMELAAPAPVVAAMVWTAPEVEPEPAPPEAADPIAPPARAADRSEGPMRPVAAKARTERAPRIASAPPEKPAAKGKKGSKKRACEDGTPGIAKVEGGLYAVEREIVDAYAKKPATLGALGWVSRHEGEDGKADGFALGGIRCGNDLHEAGLRNGDVVHSVNGKPLTSVPQALWAYTTQRKKDELQLQITRNGRERILTYKMS